MTGCAVFMLDHDKDFLTLYSALLNKKGCQVFATDNLFLLLKYAKTVEPEWIFIDEDFSTASPDDIINTINNKLETTPRYTIMSGNKDFPVFEDSSPIDYIYKPRALEKIIQIAENCCIMQ